MTRLRKIWNHDKVALVAEGFKTRNEFRKHAGGAYAWARTHGVLDAVCAHMKPLVRYDINKVKALASETGTRSDFAAHFPSAYAWAKRNNVLDEVCAHMTVIRQRWSRASVRKEAKKHKSKQTFANSSPGAYEYAQRNGLLESICQHMPTRGHRYKRALYVYEFENGSAYIGLTFDYAKRDAEHHRRGPVFRELKKSKAKFVRLEKWMPAAEAARAEAGLIEEYRKTGWRILNSAKAGGLGGDETIWTDVAIQREAQKYDTLKAFREGSPSAYATAIAKGIIESLSHLKRERSSWDFESVKKEARKYSSRAEFCIGSSGAADWARNNNVFDEVCIHMDYVRQYWDYESVAAEARKYKSRVEFQQKAGSAWMWAQRNGMLDKVCIHMRRPKQKSKWNIEKVRKIAQKYSSKAEFREYASGPYQWARKNNVLDEVCDYPKRKPKWNFETVSIEAKKYKTRSEFIKGKLHAYNWAKRNDCLDDVCSHMPRRKKA